jgi:prepilin peptidase CpaA
MPRITTRPDGQTMMQILLLGLFPAAMAFAAASDLLTMTISNRLSLGLALGFFLAAFLIGMSYAEIGWHVLAALTVLAAAFTCFSFGWIGGGDAKLAAATALWFGFSHLMDYLLLAAIFGGALTLLILWCRRWPLPAAFARQPWIVRLHEMSAGIPYGIALAVAGLMIYPETAFIRALAGGH